MVKVDFLYCDRSDGFPMVTVYLCSGEQQLSTDTAQQEPASRYQVVFPPTDSSR